MVTNLTDFEILMVMKYLISKESTNWFIYDFISINFKPNLVDDMVGPWVDFRSAEWMGDYHWVRSEVCNLSQDKEYLNFVRDYKINQINSEDHPLSTTKIELLRVDSHLSKNRSKVKYKHNYDEDIKRNFKVGDKVWFNNEPGIITYRHLEKSDGIVKYTVNVKNTFTKYVPYNLLSPRHVRDYSSVNVPDSIKKLTTLQLLNTRNRGVLSTVVKAELQNRENIKRKKITKIYGKK